MNNSLTSRVGIAIGFVLAGVVFLGFFGVPLVGLFALNHVAFIDGQDMSCDLGIVIIKSLFVKFLIVVFDIWVLHYFFTLAIKKFKTLRTNLLKKLKPYPIKTTIYKICADLDFQFYFLDFDAFQREFVYDEEDFYNDDFEGVPTVVRIRFNDKDYLDYPDIDRSKLKENSKYVVMTFKETGHSYSTKAVLNIREQGLVKLEVYRASPKGVKLVSKADIKKLKQIGFNRT